MVVRQANAKRQPSGGARGECGRAGAAVEGAASGRGAAAANVSTTGHVSAIALRSGPLVEPAQWPERQARQASCAAGAGPSMRSDWQISNAAAPKRSVATCDGEV